MLCNICKLRKIQSVITQTYFRVQPGDRDARQLLDVEEQVSRAWGRAEDDPRTTRTGVSVCDSRETLAQYLATVGQGIPYGLPGWVLVELCGDHSTDQPLDAEFGEYLIHPTEIVSVALIDDEFFDMIGDFYDAAAVGA